MRKSHRPLRNGLLLAAVLAWTVALAAQDVNKAKALLEAALEALKPAPPLIATPEAFDQALATAAPGAVLRLDPTLVYPAPLALKQAVTLESAVPAGRMTRAHPLPSFRGGLTVTGDNVTLVGLEVRHPNPLTDIMVISGAHVLVDRIRVLGDPVKGAKRGINANGNGDVTVRRSYIADCFGASPGQDTQAILAYDMAPGLLLEDNYLEAGSETLMLGGADAPEDRTPDQVTIRGNTITKNPAWFGQPIGVKNLVEFKNAKRVVFENNDCSYSWVQSQVGFLLVLTVRNQDGRAPWATIQDVTIRNNTWRDGVGAINIIGRDDIKETRLNRPVPVGTVRQSVPMARVTIEGDTFALDPAKWKGATGAKAIQISGGPIDLTIRNVTITTASPLSAALYLSESPSNTPLANFTFTGNTMPASRYGLFGAATTAAPTNWTATNPAWVKWTTGSTIADITVQ